MARIPEGWSANRKLNSQFKQFQLPNCLLSRTGSAMTVTGKIQFVLE